MLHDDYENIDVKFENKVCVVTLNRPEKRNALGQEMREELRSFFTSIKDNDEVKVILLTGEGKAFSAGGDLSALKTVDAVSGRRRLQAGHDMIHSILDLEKPVIAAVNGVAAGAGVSLALACDVIIAGHSTSFIQSFIKVGLIPDLGSIYFLPRLIGRHRAMELMLTGGKISADQAQQMGVINRIVPDDSLLDEAYSLAATLAEGPAIAMGLTKRVTNKSILADINETLELEGFAQGMCFETEDFKEGVNAFFEKRKPQFK
ncbi:enoyl-CoA hydratase/isomerase family protein [Sporosarcina sp. JAI121]|uniref:enoyl-CoA hydratase/isomerase family protein n=1 Tax=Sporosarcina sp. JAI121 TaxID=2723064 RepID=UPI0015C8007D|nr:enoyl-CoA hydratase [Sporosarcina sp. JAI121]NYF23747.1 2-(1,2-epoxy-1,2-dihydrophenyl)acetyl-CoA isomerase [Sporosarcina sp. JAI121]